MEERRALVRAYREGVDTMTALCAEFGVSRQTAYTWVRRAEREGLETMTEHSRRPHTSPSQTAPHVVEALLATRRRHPGWGPKKLLGHGWPLTEHPAPSTASAILRRAGLVPSRRRRERPPAPAAPPPALAEPNRVWTVDFKGHCRIRGVWCYPLTIIDHATRFVLACEALPSTATAGAQRVFRHVFREYGLPERLRSDNGVPFATAWAVGGLSPLAVWWIRLGIIPERIQPGCPQQNGRHERFHRTLKAATMRPPAHSWAAQQARFDAYRREFNHERPHEALGQHPPASRYVASSRPYPARLPPVAYPEDTCLRPVGAHGCILWNRRRIFVSKVVAHERVACRRLDDGLWAVYFGPLFLGYLDEHQTALDHLAQSTGGRSHAPRARG